MSLFDSQARYVKGCLVISRDDWRRLMDVVEIRQGGKWWTLDTSEG